MMLLSVLYMAFLIVVGVSTIAGFALYKIDKNSERIEKADR